MSQRFDIQEGMQVYGGDQLIGRVERLHGDGFHVNGHHYTPEMVTRVEHNRIYLGDSGMGGAALGGAEMSTDTTAQSQTRTMDTTASAIRDTAMTDNATLLGEREAGEVRVPIIEERLAVGTREVELGEVDIRKTVTEEEQTASVTLHRDEVRVEEIAVAERPLQAGDDAFNEGTIRIQLRGEEAVVAKETVVTGEVVIDKETIAEERTITDTVRRQRVDVDERYRQARTELERDHATRVGTTGRTFAESEPNYRTGFDAGHDERYIGREFADVEPDLRRDHATRGVTADRWSELRHEIEAGWNKARNR
ncbi:MAG TPA: DUF2382 domain-containing protein [Thermomicrobiales bacterium]